MIKKAVKKWIQKWFNKLLRVALMLVGVIAILTPIVYLFFHTLSPVLTGSITLVGLVLGCLLLFTAKYTLVPAKMNISEDAKDAEIAKLKQELAKERANKTLSVDNIKKVLRLVLLEMDVHYKDFKKEIITEEQSRWFPRWPWPTDRKREYEYIGYIHEKHKVQYGIDLDKLKIVEEDTKITVSGIECKYLGTLSRKPIETFSEIRENIKESVGNTWATKQTIVRDLNNFEKKAIEKHRHEALIKINTGVDLTGFEGLSVTVEKLGKDLIKHYLSLVTSKPVIFADESNINEPLQDINYETQLLTNNINN